MDYGGVFARLKSTAQIDFIAILPRRDKAGGEYDLVRVLEAKLKGEIIPTLIGLGVLHGGLGLGNTGRYGHAAPAGNGNTRLNGGWAGSNQRTGVRVELKLGARVGRGRGGLAATAAQPKKRGKQQRHKRAAADGSYGSFFETVNDERSVVSGPENELLLTTLLSVSPEASEIIPGGSFTVSTEYTGESAEAVYQWYIRDLSTMETLAIEGAAEASCTAGNELASGEYELFCTVTDDNGRYISKPSAVTVLHDAIQNVSVQPVSELSYSGNERTPIFETSASIRLGVPVSFTYSLDGMAYTPSVPSIGPAPGEYVLFYCAAAEGCDSIYREVRVTIAEPEEGFEEQKPEKLRKFNVDIRFIAIMAMVFLDLILLTIYLIIKVKND